MKRFFLLFTFSLCTTLLQAQSFAPLSVEKIMRDPKWMGVSPSNIFWGDDSKTIYFNWNPENEEQDQLYHITTSNFHPQKTAVALEPNLNHSKLIYTKDRSKALFERNGDLFIYTTKNNQETALTNTVERESNAQFSQDERHVIFQKGENLFSTSLADNQLVQLTNFTRSKERKEGTLSLQNNWLKADQLKEFDIIKVEKEKKNSKKKTEKSST